MEKPIYDHKQVKITGEGQKILNNDELIKNIINPALPNLGEIRIFNQRGYDNDKIEIDLVAKPSKSEIKKIDTGRMARELYSIVELNNFAKIDDMFYSRENIRVIGLPIYYAANRCDWVIAKNGRPILSILAKLQYPSKTALEVQIRSPPDAWHTSIKHDVKEETDKTWSARLTTTYMNSFTKDLYTKIIDFYKKAPNVVVKGA